MSEISLKFLKLPSYPFFDNEGRLYIPSKKQLLMEFFKNINIFNSKKNWLAFYSWFIFLACMVYFFYYLMNFYRIQYLAIILLYPLFILNIHSTCYLHRYSSHRAFKFSSLFWAQVFKILVPKIVIEESFAISHYVHHSIPDQPGDPYNPKGGWLYCFLADANHQMIARDLAEKDYLKLAGLIRHTGIYVNSYKQYLRWGSISHPFFTLLEIISSWVFTYLLMKTIFNHEIALAFLAGASTWAFTIRNFNYKSHGSGIDKRTKVDLDLNSWAINKWLPGMVAGEWHSNHHLFPKSARNGFRSNELDLSFYMIKILKSMNIIENYHDSLDEFRKRYE